MLISKEFTFDSAHYLTDYHGKCEKLHGHTYRLRVTVSGRVAKNGMVVDFCDLKSLVKKIVVDKLDHASLNDLFRNPSAENIVIWMWKELKVPVSKFAKGVKLHEIVLWETPNNFVTYSGK